jgi:hypothetical protein
LNEVINRSSTFWSMENLSKRISPPFCHSLQFSHDGAYDANKHDPAKNWDPKAYRWKLKWYMGHPIDSSGR